MRDIVMLLLILAFFAVCLAYVRWCDHIIGPDPGDPGDPGDRRDLAAAPAAVVDERVAS